MREENKKERGFWGFLVGVQNCCTKSLAKTVLLNTRAAHMCEALPVLGKLTVETRKERYPAE
jgi:hypothetical protein